MLDKSNIKSILCAIALSSVVIIGGITSPTFASSKTETNGVTYSNVGEGLVVGSTNSPTSAKTKTNTSNNTSVTTIGEGSSLSSYYYNKYGNAPGNGTCIASYDNTQVFKNGNVCEVWVVSDNMQKWTLCDRFSW